MKDNLLHKLEYAYVDVKLPSPDLEKEVREKIYASMGRYREDIIEDYAKENEVVRNNIKGKLKFYDIGEPIIQKVESIYQSIKDSGKGYKFNRAETLKSPECLNSIKQLEGIVDVEDYFQNGRILNNVFKKFRDGLLADHVLPSISRCFIGGYLGAKVGPVLFSSLFPWEGLEGEILDSAFGAFVGGWGGLYSRFSNNKNTPESLIKEPAERFGEDLKWMDETFDEIYRGENK